MRGETAPRATCYGPLIMADPLKPIRAGAAGVTSPTPGPAEHVVLRHLNQAVAVQAARDGDSYVIDAEKVPPWAITGYGAATINGRAVQSAKVERNIDKGHGTVTFTVR